MSESTITIKCTSCVNILTTDDKSFAQEKINKILRTKYTLYDNVENNENELNAIFNNGICL